MKTARIPSKGSSIRDPHSQVLFTGDSSQPCTSWWFCCFSWQFFPHSSAPDTWWFCIDEAKKSEFRHMSCLSPSGSHKYLQKHAAPQPPSCLEGIPPGAVGPALTCGGNPVKCSRNLPDSQKCFLLSLQDWSAFSPCLLFSCSRAQIRQDLAQSS